MNLISDYQERMERATEKRSIVIKFLQSELYSTTTIVAELLKVSRSAAYRTLQSLERDELVRKHVLNFLGREIPFYVITDHGVTENVDPSQPLKFFRPPIPMTTLQHTLDAQRVRVNTQLTDWKTERWLPGRELPKDSPVRWAIYPDATAKASRKDGSVLDVGIEIERTRKTPQRYVDIIRKHQRNIELGRYGLVIYFCPNEKARDSLKGLLTHVMKEKRLGNIEEYFLFRKYPFNY